MKKTIVGSLLVAFLVLSVFFISLYAVKTDKEGATFLALVAAALVFVIVRASTFASFVALLATICGYVANQIVPAFGIFSFLASIALLVGFFKVFIYDPGEDNEKRWIMLYIGEFSLIALPITLVCYVF
jgi:hypothetical protein